MESIRIGELEQVRSTVQARYTAISRALYAGSAMAPAIGVLLYGVIGGGLGILSVMAGVLCGLCCLAFGLSTAEDGAAAVGDIDSSLSYPYMGWVVPREEWREFAIDHNLKTAADAMEWVAKGLAVSCLMYCLGLVFTGSADRIGLMRFCSLGFLTGLAFAGTELTNLYRTEPKSTRCIVTPGGILVGSRYIPVVREGAAFTGLGVLSTGTGDVVRIEYGGGLPLLGGNRQTVVPIPGDPSIDHNRLTDYLWGLWESAG